MNNTFPKRERLNSKKLIKELFTKGSSFHLYPLRIMYLPNPEENSGPDQVLFSVPKRYFKKAVDRNKIKRRLREAYRRNKHLLNDGNEMPHSFLIGYIYTAKDIIKYQELEDKLKSSLQRLKENRSKIS